MAVILTLLEPVIRTAIERRALPFARTFRQKSDPETDNSPAALDMPVLRGG